MSTQLQSRHDILTVLLFRFRLSCFTWSAVHTDNINNQTTSFMLTFPLYFLKAYQTRRQRGECPRLTEKGGGNVCRGSCPGDVRGAKCPGECPAVPISILWCECNSAAQHRHSLSGRVFLSSGENVVVCLLKFSSEKIPRLNSHFRCPLSIFLIIQFSFLKLLLIVNFNFRFYFYSNFHFRSR